MRVYADETRLKRALQEILKHKLEMDKSHLGDFKTFRIKKYVLSKENLQKILLLSLQARAGPSLNISKCKKVYRQFNRNIDIGELKKIKDPTKRFEYLYEQTTKVKYIGPKIALVFLKDMVYHDKICKELVKELRQPVDVHLQKIFIDKLKVFKKEEVPGPSESIKTKKNKNFQKALAKIHNPIIEFDYFWYIGNRFCAKRVACHLCWIRKYCQKPYFVGKNLDL